MREERTEVGGEWRHAVFSDEDPALYRYCLDIIWGDGPILTTIGLNPSTADQFQDDPTMARVEHASRPE